MSKEIMTVKEAKEVKHWQMCNRIVKMLADAGYSVREGKEVLDRVSVCLNGSVRDAEVAGSNPVAPIHLTP